jgi:hypothetical protein
MSVFSTYIVCNISRSQSETWVKKIQAAAYNGMRTVPKYFRLENDENQVQIDWELVYF